MKAVIFCDGPGFAARARSILLRVGRRPEVDVRWIVKPWPIAALGQTASSQNIRSEVEDAHLVVISGDQARLLPRHLRNWLVQWATHRRIEEAAVGVIDESDHPGFQAFFDLERLIDEHGLSLVTRQTPAARQPTEIFPTRSEEPVQRLPLERTQHRKQPGRLARRERLLITPEI
jgi:hypothetical protein